VTNARKQAKQTKKLSRGQRLQSAATEAINPSQVTAIIICDPDEIQKSVGAYQNRSSPAWPCTASKKRSAGKTPCGPIKPSIWKNNEKNAEK